MIPKRLPRADQHAPVHRQQRWRALRRRKAAGFPPRAAHLSRRRAGMCGHADRRSSMETSSPFCLPSSLRLVQFQRLPGSVLRNPTLLRRERLPGEMSESPSPAGRLASDPSALACRPPCTSVAACVRSCTAAERAVRAIGDGARHSMLSSRAIIARLLRLGWDGSACVRSAHARARGEGEVRFALVLLADRNSGWCRCGLEGLKARERPWLASPGRLFRLGQHSLLLCLGCS